MFHKENTLTGRFHNGILYHHYKFLLLHMFLLDIYTHYNIRARLYTRNQPYGAYSKYE